MSPLYPFRFQPILRRYVWGGRRLGSLLGKPIGEGNDYAESWEIVDRASDQSIVAAGPLEGATLHQLLAEHGLAILGRHHPQSHFPLLLKFLDARAPLSVQVHPDDGMAARLALPDCGKTEAWVVLAAEPGSVLYAGLKPGVDCAVLEQAVARGTVEHCLHRLEPGVGDCFFIPAGMVHALGAGLVVAEIQQPSDTTFRLFDWNRVSAEGKRRPLHIEQALGAIDYTYGPAVPQTPVATERPHVSRLVACERFVADRWQFDMPDAIGGDERCHVLVVLDGHVDVAGEPLQQPLSRGATALIPAALGPIQLAPHGPASLLDVWLP